MFIFPALHLVYFMIRIIKRITQLEFKYKVYLVHCTKHIGLDSCTKNPRTNMNKIFQHLLVFLYSYVFRLLSEKSANRFEQNLPTFSSFIIKSSLKTNLSEFC